MIGGRFSQGTGHGQYRACQDAWQRLWQHDAFYDLPLLSAKRNSPLACMCRVRLELLRATANITMGITRSAIVIAPCQQHTLALEHPLHEE